MSFLVDEQLEAYAEAHTTPPSELFARLAEETLATVPVPDMLTGSIAGRFLELLVHGTGRSRCSRSGR